MFVRACCLMCLDVVLVTYCVMMHAGLCVYYCVYSLRLMCFCVCFVTCCATLYGMLLCVLLSCVFVRQCSNVCECVVCVLL